MDFWTPNLVIKISSKNFFFAWFCRTGSNLTSHGDVGRHLWTISKGKELSLNEKSGRWSASHVTQIFLMPHTVYWSTIPKMPFQYLLTMTIILLFFLFIHISTSLHERTRARKKDLDEKSYGMMIMMRMRFNFFGLLLQKKSKINT